MNLSFADADLRPHRISRGRYEALVDSGFYDGERVELIAGLVVDMSPENAGHAWAIRRLSRLLLRALGERAELLVQNPLRCAGESEPEPDLAVVPPGDYRRVHPDAAWLVIEVADSSLAYDRGVKRALYAQSGVEEYWIVNLRARQIEIWRDRQGEAYATEVVVPLGGVAVPAAFPEVAVPVADLF